MVWTFLTTNGAINKYYLNVAKTENYTSGSGVRKRTFTKSKRDKKFVLQEVLYCVVSAGKKAQKLLIDIVIYFVS